MAIQASSVVLCAANSRHEMRRSSDDLATEVGEDGSVAKAEPLVTAACESWWHMTGVDGGRDARRRWGGTDGADGAVCAGGLTLISDGGLTAVGGLPRLLDWAGLCSQEERRARRRRLRKPPPRGAEAEGQAAFGASRPINPVGRFQFR